MNKPTLGASCAIGAAVLALSLSACGHAQASPGAVSLAPAGSPLHRVTLVIRPQIEPAAGFRTQTVIAPYTAADVATVSVLLLDPTSPAAPLAEEDLASGSFGDVVTFTDLAPDTTYQVLSRAFDATGATLSVDASSSLTLSVTHDDQIGPLTLPVQLVDRIFSGTVTFGMQINDGHVVHVGSPSITVGTPAP